MRAVEVVPAHLIHANGEHGFKRRVEAKVDQSGHVQLVDVEGGGVAEVEDVRMTQRLRLKIKRRIVGQYIKQSFKQAVGGVEIRQQLLAEHIRVGAIQAQVAGVVITQGKVFVVRHDGAGNRGFDIYTISA